MTPLHDTIDKEIAIYDFAVIGGGIVGSAIARDLAGYDVSVALIDSRAEVGEGTSKANTAILHTGFDAKPGTLESRLVARGYELLSAYGAETGIPIENTGAVLVAWDEEQRDALPSLKKKAEQNGYTECRIVSADDVYEMVPDLGDGALAGLTVPGESIICTWTTNLALATDAVSRGVTPLLGREVKKVRPGPEVTVIETSLGEVAARWVVNAAGLGSDYVDADFGYNRFTINPRRGELFVFDKLARPKVPKIVLPVPTSKGKGVLVSPTIYGNVMLGPTAEDMENRDDTSTTDEGYEFLLEKGERLMPSLLNEEVTATYAGLRAASSAPDYTVDVDLDQRYVVAGGIRSTGLTSGMAIAEYVVGKLNDGGMQWTARENLPSPPEMPNIGETGLRPYQNQELIAEDPAYGKVVCFCERVTQGEIRDCLSSVVPATTLSGISRRTRATNGRCQGFYCGAEVQKLLDDSIKQSEGNQE